MSYRATSLGITLSGRLTAFEKAKTMTVITKSKPRVALFSGKGSLLRTTALMQVATLAFAEDVSRAAALSNMRIVLGKSPTEAQTKAAKTEHIIGRVASRLPVGELPKGKTSPVDRLEYARLVVCSMARAPKEGTRAKALRKDQVGRRSAIQQRIVRAAEEACSVFFAELGLSNAGTNSQRAKAKRAPSMAGTGKGKKGSAPSHSELVKPAAPTTSDDYVNHMQTQMAALVAYDNKYAKTRPTTHGAFAEALVALRQLGNKAANEYQVRKAKVAANA